MKLLRRLFYALVGMVIGAVLVLVISTAGALILAWAMDMVRRFLTPNTTPGQGLIVLLVILGAFVGFWLAWKWEDL